MAEDNKSMFVLVSIIAIVAVVGLVVLLMGKSAQYVPASTGIVEETAVEEGDLAGEAYGAGGNSGIWVGQGKTINGPTIKMIDVDSKATRCVLEINNVKKVINVGNSVIMGFFKVAVVDAIAARQQGDLDACKVVINSQY